MLDTVFSKYKFNFIRLVVTEPCNINPYPTNVENRVSS